MRSCGATRPCHDGSCVWLTSGLSKAKQAATELLFSRVSNDKVFAGEFDEGFTDMYMSDSEDDAEERVTTNVKWHSFEIGFDDKKTKFIFVRHSDRSYFGDMPNGEKLLLVAGDGSTQDRCMFGRTTSCTSF